MVIEAASIAPVAMPVLATVIPEDAWVQQCMFNLT
jgi:hypothetical protein